MGIFGDRGAQYAEQTQAKRIGHQDHLFRSPGTQVSGKGRDNQRQHEYQQHVFLAFNPEQWALVQQQIA
jgi:hypothetical protein